jgi:SAM-dependent methyltransferase
MRWESSGRLWCARAADWAEEEEREAPKFAAVIERVGVAPGQAVLDVGCGSGVFLSMAADRGARPSGLDASEALIGIARRRVPGADLRVGDMTRLPWAADAFDLVTGFNSFVLADDVTAALREAGRVARAGAPVVVQVWGRPERSDLTPMLRAIRALWPGPAPPAAPPMSQPGVLEAAAGGAGLAAGEVFDVAFALEYADERELLRTMLSAGAVVEATEAHGERAVAGAILAALEPFRTGGGGYRLETEWHTLVARVPAGPGVSASRRT